MKHIKVFNNFINERLTLPTSGGYSGAMFFKHAMAGRKDIHFLVTKHPRVNSDDDIRILQKYRDIGWGVLTVDKEDGDAYIAYRPNATSKKKAKRLKAIADSHGGYLADKTPEEAREIGELLDYSTADINRYVKRVY
jgi:hypothetical protein